MKLYVFSGIMFAVLAGTVPAAPLNAAARPNFVFVLGEGHGWASTSVQMCHRAK